MNQFKLLAVTPLHGCLSQYCKNLIPGRPYQFYSNYKIRLSKNGEEIKSAEKADDLVPENLYELSNGIGLNFSAVVGKNGTGKSTIFELFAYFIYVLSSHKEIDGRKVLGTEMEALEAEYYSAVEDLQKLQKLIKNYGEDSAKQKPNPDLGILAHTLHLQERHKLIVLKTNVKDELSFALQTARELNARIIGLEFEITKQREWHNQLLSGLAVSVLYESEGGIKEASYSAGAFHFSDFSPEKIPAAATLDDFDLESFFYSISVNFSHHGLNSNTIGRWINKLFHKNDAYITPLVINPMRDEGNFNINHELSLSKERLHANLLFDLVQKEKTLLLNKYKIKEFIFYPKVLPSVFVHPFKDEKVSELKSITVLKGLLNEKELQANLPYWDIALSYLDKKIAKIKKNYGFLIYKNDGRSEKEQFDYFLATDNTHVTKKIRQVLNFLAATSLEGNEDFWRTDHSSGDLSISFNRNKMLEWLKIFEPSLVLKLLTPSDLIELGLPGFFNIDLLLSDRNGNPIAFSKLSSGEQQMILNSNGLLYHLSNINSAHGDGTGKEPMARTVYKNVNIILDEVELYYHPEMQRNLISDLIRTFEKVRRKTAEGIQGINVCILTHSPFILSDIPSQNVLTLADKTDELLLSRETQTFGANIHDMLIGRFFMESTTGEHVRTLIQEMLDLYSRIRLVKTRKAFDSLKAEFFFKRDKFNFLVETIGEEVVCNILRNHLDFMDDIFNGKVTVDYEKN